MIKSKKIYICTTNLCQLHCKGCYMSSAYNLQERTVDLDLVREVINNTLLETDNIECVFHGGEPFFKHDNETIQKYIDLIQEYPQLKWGSTTNLVYTITPKLLELFSLFTDKLIKTSWDVDSYRFNEEQLKLWENNVKFLLGLGYDIEPIITINTDIIKHSPKEILEYIKNFCKGSINFERITDTGRAITNSTRPTNREVDSWLYEAYIYNKENTKLLITLFDELEGIAQGQEPIGCKRRECMQCVTTIMSDNTIGTCPNSTVNNRIAIKDNNKLVYNTELYEKLIKAEKLFNHKCLTCKFYKICHGECCQLRFDETGCPGLLKILEHIKKEYLC